MMSFTEDEEMYERAKDLRDQVHRDGVRIDEVVDAIVDCGAGAELFARRPSHRGDDGRALRDAGLEPFGMLSFAPVGLTALVA